MMKKEGTIVSLMFSRPELDGKSQLCKHLLWVFGKDFIPFHSMLRVGSVIIHYTYDGVEVSAAPDPYVLELLESVDEHIEVMVPGELDQLNPIILEGIRWGLEVKHGPTVPTGIRYLLGLPLEDGYEVCHSFISKLLGFDATYPDELLTGFIKWSIEANATYVGARITSSSLVTALNGVLHQGVSPTMAEAL